MSAATKLGLYNAALGLLQQRKLSTLTDSVETRRVLDEVWDRGKGFVNAVLEQGLWNFAVRASQFDASADITVSFGLPYGFERPSDFVRLVGIASDEMFHSPLTGRDYVDEGGVWYANCDPIYVRYISDGASYGGDYSLWPETFTRYAEAELAAEAAGRITKNDSLEEKMRKLADKRLKDARSKDAMNEGTGFLPAGSWQRARRGGGRERGVTSRLIG